MLMWETDAPLRDNALGAEFANICGGLANVVFSRTLELGLVDELRMFRNPVVVGGVG